MQPHSGGEGVIARSDIAVIIVRAQFLEVTEAVINLCQKISGKISFKNANLGQA